MNEKRQVKVAKVPVPPPSRESAYSALNGVTVDWLRRVFRMTSRSVEAKLVGCPVIGTATSGSPLYDPATAAQYLVKPKMDLRDYLADITVDDLPDKLKEPFWNAKLKQQRFEKNAGELWRTEAVIQLFGSVLKDVKEHMRLVPELAEKQLGMTVEQLQGLREIVNVVQGGIYEHIQKLDSYSPSSIAELNKEYGAEDEPDYESPTKSAPESDEYEY